MDSRSLHAAAKTGNMDLLYELIHEDPYVLDKIDSIPFVDTPLHVAAVAGQTEFAMELMNLKPSFARKLNADGYTPLHLAVDHSHNWLVLQLLKLDPSLVRLKGRKGMTPLLLAVSGEKIDLISEFFLACPESIVDANVNGENALHIAVKNNNNNQTEGVTVLKVIMGWIRRLCQKDAEWTEKRVINGRDKDGNTPLHLAASENDVSAGKLMLDSLRINVNIQNKDGYTVLDTVVLKIQEHNRGDIEKMIKWHGGKHSVSLVKVKTMSDILSSKLTSKESKRTLEVRAYSWISEERRNALLVVATLLVTATYQTVLQPPGGVSDSGEKAGSVIMKEKQFISLWLWNSVGFYVAMSATLGLLSLGHESVFWYFPMFLPLFVAYNVAGKVISPNSRAFTIGAVGACIVTIVSGIGIAVFRVLKDNRAKDRGPKSGLVWEGYTSVDQARGLAPKGYAIW